MAQSQRYASRSFYRRHGEAASLRVPGFCSNAPNTLALSNRWYGFPPGIYTDLIWRPASTLAYITRPLLQPSGGGSNVALQRGRRGRFTRRIVRCF